MRYETYHRYIYYYYYENGRIFLEVGMKNLLKAGGDSIVCEKLDEHRFSSD